MFVGLGEGLGLGEANSARHWEPSVEEVFVEEVSMPHAEIKNKNEKVSEDWRDNLVIYAPK